VFMTLRDGVLSCLTEEIEAHTTHHLMFSSLLMFCCSSVNDDWLEGKLKGETGIFPKSFVQNM